MARSAAGVIALVCVSGSRSLALERSQSTDSSSRALSAHRFRTSDSSLLWCVRLQESSQEKLSVIQEEKLQALDDVQNTLVERDDIERQVAQYQHKLEDTEREVALNTCICMPCG